MLFRSFGVEEEEASASEGASEGPTGGSTIKVSEVEYRIKLPPSTTKTLPGDTYTFEVTNDGKQVHNLFVNGPGVENKGTPNLQPGQTAKLTLILKAGTYDLYCSIPGHKQLGMDAKLAVGS